MVAELVETSRLWGRTAARIDPEWVEPLAGHLVKRTYSEPRWDRRRGSVVATERVTLYGLPIVAGPHGRATGGSTRRSRASCSSAARWSRATGRRATRSSPRTRGWSRRSRRSRSARGGATSSSTTRRSSTSSTRAIPADVVSAAALRPLVARRSAAPTRSCSTYTRELLVDAQAADALDPQAWPTAGARATSTLRLTYRFEPGAERRRRDGPRAAAALGALRADRFEWLVPALRAELVTTLIRSLPEGAAPPAGAGARDRGAGARGAQAAPRAAARRVAREIERLRGVRVPPEAWDLDRLPPHLRMTFRVEDEAARRAGRGRATSTRCARRSRPRLRAELTAPAAQLERRGRASWDDRHAAARGDAARHRPGRARLPGAGRRGRDRRRARAGDARRAGAAMRAGTRRLLLLTAPSPARYVTDRLVQRRQAHAARRPARQPRGGARRRRGGGARRADGPRRRAGVGRGGVRAPARPRRRRRSPSTTAAGGRPGRARSSTPRATSRRCSSR